MSEQRDLRTPDGRTLRVTDAGGDGAVVLWHAGSPQTGAVIAPVLAAAETAGVRIVTWARPGYSTSTRRPGRSVADAAADALIVADALGLGRFAAVGYSGGGPHAIAAAALLPDRVTAVGTLAGIAPDTGTDDWLAGMAAPAALVAARSGLDARAALPDDFDPASFTDTDWAALEGPWSALGEDAQAGGREGPLGLIDDDVAFARPWGIDLAAVEAPVLLVQGEADRVVPPAHGRLLAAALRRAELRLRPGDGHVSVLGALPEVLAWVARA
ncbi:alpha/beta hydrolase [Amnibacterium sp.]|uniref:alpha/beta fold hydrolase n=1 Tax=Amnibacterium sp. TaxID=1872496 RepID=UPI002626EEA4|nr:alpha/beta hydrolase [Amnibacterium sp.]MCU1471942.1 alpha/beta hydrolase [Amnibacterium sp.]